MLRSLPIIAALVLTPTASLAESYQLTIKNGYTDAVSGVSVSGGKLQDFKPIPANSRRAYSVTMPDGKCVVRISINFANGHHYDAGKMDLCEYDTLDVWFE